MTTNLGLIYTAFPDVTTARTITRTLVNEGLVLCANIMPAGISIYRWQRELTESAEAYTLLKVAPGDVTAATERLRQLHPYESPAIIQGGTFANPDFLQGFTNH